MKAKKWKDHSVEIITLREVGVLESRLRLVAEQRQPKASS